MDEAQSPEAIASLRVIPVFAGVSTEILESIASLLIERRFPKHKTIVEEGAPGDYMYIISKGRVKVTKLSGDGREKILELLDVGDFFGEMSLFDALRSRCMIPFELAEDCSNLKFGTSFDMNWQ